MGNFSKDLFFRLHEKYLTLGMPYQKKGQKNMDKEKLFENFLERGLFELRSKARQLEFECLEDSKRKTFMLSRGPNNIVAEFWPTTSKFRLNEKRLYEGEVRELRDWAKESGFFKQEVTK